MCFDVSIPIRLIWSTDGLPLSEINSNDLILAHSMPRGPSTPTTVVSPAAILVLRRFRVRRAGHHAAPVGGLCRPVMDLVLCDRALAVSVAWPRTGVGR